MSDEKAGGDVVVKKKKRHTYSVSRKGMGGRPPKWKTPEELQKLIDECWEECKKLDKPFTMSRLAVALKTDRKTLVNYAHKDEFFPTIKQARARAEAFAEDHMFSGKAVAGAIFSAKNNYGWVDKQEIALSGSVDINHFVASSRQIEGDVASELLEDGDEMIEGELLEE